MDGFWTQWIDGRLWLMFKQYRVALLATTFAQIEEAIREREEAGRSTWRLHS